MAAIWELSHPGLDDIAELRQLRHLLDMAGANGVVASCLDDKYSHLRALLFIEYDDDPRHVLPFPRAGGLARRGDPQKA